MTSCVKKLMEPSGSSACYDPSKNAGGHEDPIDLISHDTAILPHPSKQGQALHNDLEDYGVMRAIRVAGWRMVPVARGPIGRMLVVGVPCVGDVDAVLSIVGLL
jgi:hypothetical protein